MQVERHGEAWYIDPIDDRRYYLGRPTDAFNIMRFLGLGITNQQLTKVPPAGVKWDGDAALMSRVHGRILLQVEEHGEAWYVNPTDGRRYYLGRPDDAFALMSGLGLGITDDDLFQITPAIEIISVNGNSNPTEEFVVIENSGQFTQSLASWSLSDGNAQVFNFPKNTSLAPGATLRVYTSGHDLNFGLNESIWFDTSAAAHLFGERHTLIDKFQNDPIPSSALIDIPFTTQAPFGNWKSPYNEACEEAILSMLHHWDEGDTLTAETANRDILAIVDWEMRNYGWHEDTSSAYTARTAREYYGLGATVAKEVNADTIRQLIAQGKPVIVPVFGKALNNPHYRNGGPYYHMILIVGYEGSYFITHDPGTQYGKNYRVTDSVLLSAIHDLTDPESDIANGQPAMIIIE